jgi:hypothetical protein
MFVRRTLIPLALALLGAGCSDERQPTAVPPPALAPHFLRWAGGVAPQFTMGDPFSGRSPNGVLMTSPSDGLSLTQYTTAFWAVRGQLRSVQINYLSATGDSTFPFLRLTTDDPAFVPGRGNLELGDSVLITVTIDRANIKVSLEPTGLQFGSPAELQIWYGGADGDLNGDAVVDSADAFIEGQLLGMWYREGEESAWTQIPAMHALADKSFISALQHFCEYAVSW